MKEHKAYSLQYEVDALKQQLTNQFPISEPTIRQVLIRILVLIETLLDEHKEE